jgi:hypothetical protein
MFRNKKLTLAETRAAAKAKIAADIVAAKANEDKVIAIASAKANFGKDFLWSSGPVTQFSGK